MVLLNSTRTVTTTIPHQTEPGLLYTCTSQANRINCITQLSSSHPQISACGRFCAAFHCVTPQTALRRGRRGGETPILGSLSTRGCLLSLWLCGGCAVHSAVLVLVLVRNQVLAVPRARAVHMHLDTGAVRCLRKHSVRNVTRWCVYAALHGGTEVYSYQRIPRSAVRMYCILSHRPGCFTCTAACHGLLFRARYLPQRVFPADYAGEQAAYRAVHCTHRTGYKRSPAVRSRVDNPMGSR